MGGGSCLGAVHLQGQITHCRKQPRPFHTECAIRFPSEQINGCGAQLNCTQRNTAHNASSATARAASSVDEA